MISNKTTDSAVAPRSFADRYQVEKTLGRGGMAVVFQVLDTSTNKRIALKSLLLPTRDNKRRTNCELFEHEFYTLSQLAHPRVIEVYDYGVDETGPYYTMELLQGGDLRQLSPLPWQRVCSILHDICSSLSLLHSRKLVHRDVSTRNIRCNKDGIAKLIDFGAMAPMAPCKRCVGTPPFTPPEVVNLQTLDARADLFSLGAAAYYTLTGRHAYPVRHFTELRDIWRNRLAAPSTYVPDIPKSVDNLVMSLLSLNPRARPSSTAEVMELLTAIVGERFDEQLLVSQSYLSTPGIVARSEYLLHVRKLMVSAQRGEGATLVVRGDPGVGRSRFLDACVMEGKLAGAIVLRADATDAQMGNYGVVRALSENLLEAAPELASKLVKPFIPILSHVVPELRDRFSEMPLETLDDPHQLRPRVQSELRKWLLDISLEQSLVIAVDDVHRIDEPSLALLALLANETNKNRLVVVVTVETDAEVRAPQALKLLTKAAYNLVLRNLNIDDCIKLVRSIFGDVSNCDLVARRLFTLSNGNPRTIMELSQHLLDKRIARYQRGTWRLPSQLDITDLPATFTEAQRERLRRVSTRARKLAETISLCPDQSLTRSECKILTEHRNINSLQPILDELVTENILARTGQVYALAQPGWMRSLNQNLSPDFLRDAHLKLAAMFEYRADDDFRVAQHLIRAGEYTSGLNALVGFFTQVIRRLELNANAAFELIQSLPSDWVDTVETAIQVCHEIDRPQRDVFVLRRGIVSIYTVVGSLNRDNLDRLFERLVQDSGLLIYHTLKSSLDDSMRLASALQQTQRQYDQCPPHERVATPIEAIKQLAHVVIRAASNFAWGFDYAGWESLPSLQPLTPLAPILSIVEKTAQSIGEFIAGRNERFHQACLEILARIDEPDRAGLDETLYRYMRLNVMFAIGLIEASWGATTTLQWTEELDADPLHQINAWRIRTVYHLFQGDFEQAEVCQRHAEVLTVQNSPPQFYDGMTLYTELLANTSTDNLRGLRQSIESIEAIAASFSGWEPVLHWVRGEYHRIRGELKGALEEHEKALRDTVPGQHQVWGYMAAAHVKTLIELRRFDVAITIANKYLDACRDSNIGYMLNYLLIQVALAEAHAGEYKKATDRCEEAIANYESLNITGLYLGIAYEIRTRIAILVKDQSAFDTYAWLCAKQYRAGNNSALAPRFKRLVDEAHDAQLEISPRLAQVVEFSEYSTLNVGRLVESVLSACHEPHERAILALEMLIRHSGATSGYLYTIQEDEPVLSAQRGERPPPDGLDELVRTYISAEIDDSDEATVTGSEHEACFENAANWNGEKYGMCRPLLLSHHTADGFAITGLAVLFRDNDPELSFNIPWKISTIVSKTLLESGDVSVTLRRTS